MLKKIILFILFFTNHSLAFDLNLICETHEIIGNETNNYGTLGTGLIIDNTNNNLFILTKLSDLDAKYTFSWTDKTTSFLYDIINPNDLVLTGELFHRSLDYQLSVFKIKIGKINITKCKFDDPEKTDRLYLITKDFNIENNINKYKTSIFNFSSLRQENNKIYFSSKTDKNKTVGGGIVINQNDEVVSFLHATNNDKVIGISGKTIIKYLRSIKYPNEPPIAPTEETHPTTILVDR